MKKAIITLLVAMAFTTQYAAAQRTVPYPHQDGKKQKHYQQMQHALNQARRAAKATATDVRLISTGTDYHDGTAFQPSDSVTYAYSPGKYGSFDDLWLNWKWDFDASVSYDYNGTSYDPYWKEIVTYAPDGKMSTYISQEWNTTTSAWDNYSKDTFIYNTAGNLITGNYWEWNSGTGTWDLLYRTTYTYNAANKVLTMLQEEWDGTAWDDLVDETYTWDASNRCTTWVVRFSFGSTWDNAIREHYSYDGSGNRTNTISENWDMMASEWDTVKYAYSSFVTNHQPQTAITMQKNETTMLFENTDKTNYTYNSYGKPDYEFSEKWHPTTSTWAVDTYSYATRYHYETYTTNVDHITGNNVTADIYPIPAAANINVNITWNEAQRYRATITDATGRVHMSWTSPAMAKTHQETISVADLPPGNYVLTLRGDKDKVAKQFTVVR